jgi:hypothetical protein
MMDLFTPPGLSSDEANDDILDESADDDEEEDDDDSSTDTTDSESSQDSATARKVCKLWKARRKQEKEKVLRLRQEAHLYSDQELQIASKGLALTIQRSYERNRKEGSDVKCYERYGTMARFMRDKKKK